MAFEYHTLSVATTRLFFGQHVPARSGRLLVQDLYVIATASRTFIAVEWQPEWIGLDTADGSRSWSSSRGQNGAVNHAKHGAKSSALASLHGARALDCTLAHIVGGPAHHSVITTYWFLE